MPTTAKKANPTPEKKVKREPAKPKKAVAHRKLGPHSTYCIGNVARKYNAVNKMHLCNCKRSPSNPPPND